MLEPQSLGQLQRTITDSMQQDKKILDQLRDEVRPLRANIRRIMPRTSCAGYFPHPVYLRHVVPLQSLMLPFCNRDANRPTLGS